MSEVWIVDDEPTICWALRKGLETDGFRVHVFSTAEGCLDHLRTEASSPHAILLDVRLPGRSGLELMSELQSQASPPAVILMTAFGDLKIAVEAVRGKAFDYLTKPFDLSEAMDSVHRAVGNPRTTTHGPDEELMDPWKQDMILGSSRAMQQVYKQIALASNSEATVLIEGESGSGKSSVASMIHRLSGRAPEPFLFFRPIIDRPSESEAELFGSALPPSKPSLNHDATNVVQPGLLSLAAMGTLVIEEPSALSLGAQAKLLSAMETGCYQPVHSGERVELRARLLFTSSTDLNQAVDEEESLASFVAQIQLFKIVLPPLRERREDIRALVQAFLGAVSPDRRLRITDEAMKSLEPRPWLGNVRELKHTIQRAAIRARGHLIELADVADATSASSILGASGVSAGQLAASTRQWLASQLGTGDAIEPLDASSSSGFLHEECLAVVERALIEEMLQRCDGNRAAIAARLGMHRTTLRQKIKRYGLE
jgi:DNA-binding NtrC family response regulator